MSSGNPPSLSSTKLWIIVFEIVISLTWPPEVLGWNLPAILLPDRVPVAFVPWLWSKSNFEWDQSLLRLKTWLKGIRKALRRILLRKISLGKNYLEKITSKEFFRSRIFPSVFRKPIEAHTVGYEENIMDQKRKTQPNIAIQSQLHNK